MRSKACNLQKRAIFNGVDLHGFCSPAGLDDAHSRGYGPKDVVGDLVRSKVCTHRLARSCQGSEKPAAFPPQGLMTPIVKHADQKTLSEISSAVKDLAERARSGKLKPEEFQGGSFR